MSQRNETVRRVEALTVDQIRNAYVHDVGYSVERRLEEDVLKGVDPAAVLQGIGVAIRYLDNDPTAISKDDRKGGLIRAAYISAKSLKEADELPKGFESVRLLRGALFVAHVLSMDIEDARRRGVLAELVQPLNKLINGVVAESDLCSHLTTDDAELILGTPQDERDRNIALGALLELDLVSEETQRALGVYPGEINDGLWGQELLPKMQHDSSKDEQPENGNLVEVGSTDSEVLFGLFGASDLDELEDRMDAYILEGKDRVFLTSLFNKICENRLCDEEVDFEESLAYFNALKVLKDEEGGDDQEPGDAERVESMLIILDYKLLQKGRGLEDRLEFSELELLLAKHVMLSRGEDVNFGARLKAYYDLYQAVFDYKSTVPPKNVSTGQELVQERKNIEDAEGFDLDKNGLHIVAETIRLKRLEVMKLDEEGLKALDDDHLLKSMYDEAKQTYPDNAKVEFIGSVLRRVGTGRSIDGGMGAVYMLTDLRKFIDDPVVIEHLAIIRDDCFIRLVRGLFRRAEDVEGFRRVVDVIESISFISDKFTTGEMNEIAEARWIHSEAKKRIS